MSIKIETLARAKMLEIAFEIERTHGAQESDWDMAQIWRDFNNGELEPLYGGLIKVDARTAAETVHNALYSRKTNALIQCIADAQEAAETQTDGFKCKGRLLQCKLQQISKGRNSGFWVAPKIYLFGATKTLDRITGRGYNNVHQVRRTHKNAEGG